jgi:hypothetical protein
MFFPDEDKIVWDPGDPHDDISVPDDDHNAKARTVTCALSSWLATFCAAGP